jgi:hypothetical protein
MRKFIAFYAFIAFALSLNAQQEKLDTGMIAKVDARDLNNSDLMRSCRVNRQHYKGRAAESNNAVEFIKGEFI